MVGTGVVGSSYQGYSVSLSADGNTAIVGGYEDDFGLGASWVFIRSGGIWTQEGPKLVGTGGLGAFGGAQQGFSVSLSADGNTALVGGWYDNSQVGAAWVFTRSGGVWTQQGAKLVGTPVLQTYSNQGCSVSISADGKTAIVGGYSDNGNEGAAWIYILSGGEWTQQAKLVGVGVVGSRAGQGWGVSLNADGNTAMVGGWYDNGNLGAAWVFTRNGGVWTQQGPKLVGSGVSGMVYEGASVSLSADGNTAIIGSDGDFSVGDSWVFTRIGGVWTQQGSALQGTGSSGTADQGTSVSLSADGSTAIVGGEQDNATIGAAWVFVNSGALPLNFLGLTATQKSSDIQLDWKVASESGVDHYEAERSLNGTNFIKINNNVGAIGASSYSLLDPAPNKGVNFYRIKAVEVSGEVRYTDIVKVILGGARGISINPNPISGRHISLQFSNEPTGAYSINIMNVVGQLMYHTTLNHEGGNSIRGIELPSRVAPGIYQVQIAMPDNSNNIQQIIIEN